MNVFGVAAGELADVCAVGVHHKNLGHARPDRHECDLLSVRRPRRRVIFITAERELAHVTAMTRAVRIHHMHLHSAMPARDEHNLSRIRRPERLVVNHPREGAEFHDRKIVRARAGDDC